MDPLEILDRYYPAGDPAREILFEHSRLVASKAGLVALRYSERQGAVLDLQFIEEAAILHDIGIRYVHAPEIGCFGDLPYLAHGYKGRELLETEGLRRHALVCERHIGVGLRADEIAWRGLPLPLRDMLPETFEEKIVAYADLFFSKKVEEISREKGVDEVRGGLMRFGAEKVAIFDAWHAAFS